MSLAKAEDLGSRAMLEKATGYSGILRRWMSIRPGWFYHAEEDSKVKSLKHLADIYFQSVGYNSVLLLNIPPDRRGLINEADVQRLNEFAAYREKIFTNNQVKRKKDWGGRFRKRGCLFFEAGVRNQCCDDTGRYYESDNGRVFHSRGIDGRRLAGSCEGNDCRI